MKGVAVSGHPTSHTVAWALCGNPSTRMPAA